MPIGRALTPQEILSIISPRRGGVRNYPQPALRNPAASVGSAGPSLATKNMAAIAGQDKTCAGPREKTFDLNVIETEAVDLGMGVRFAAWTYDGRIPGPTLETCEGDTVTIRVHNKGTTSHGLDTHAFKIDARRYGPTAPGTTLAMGEGRGHAWRVHVPRRCRASPTCTSRAAFTAR